MSNVVGYFEIPVTDLDRAIWFYEPVLGHTFEREVVDGNELALFPYDDGAPGASGALAKGGVYEPSHAGRSSTSPCPTSMPY